MPKLPLLEKLWINGSNLIIVPKDILQFTNLKTLSLENNNLTFLPYEFGNLCKLETLYLRNNWLTTLPITISKLKRLEHFDISYNMLIQLPTEIGNLKKVRRLDLKHNCLISLPTEIGSMKDLSDLYVDDNILLTIPSSLGKKRGLVIRLDYNPILYIPKEIHNIRAVSTIVCPFPYIYPKPTNSYRSTNVYGHHNNYDKLTDYIFNIFENITTILQFILKLLYVVTLTMEFYLR